MNQEKNRGADSRPRQRHHMTQLQLAEAVGVSDKAVSKWERGRGAPDISLLPALSEALGADTGAFSGEIWRKRK